MDELKIAADETEYEGVPTVSIEGEVCEHPVRIVLNLTSGDVLEENASHVQCREA